MSDLTLRTAVREDIVGVLRRRFPERSEADLVELALDAVGLVYLGEWPAPKRRVYAERVKAPKG